MTSGVPHKMIDTLTQPDTPAMRMAAAIRTLRRAWPAISDRLYPEAKELDVGVVSLDALFVLVLRHPVGAPMSVLAGSMRMDASTATRLVDRLVARGLATRDRSAQDGRVSYVRATTLGIELQQRLSLHAKAVYEHLLPGEFAPDELAVLADLFERFVAALDGSTSGQSSG